MTEQSITVTKIEPHTNYDDLWLLHVEGCENFVSVTTDEVRAMGLTPPADPITVTVDGWHFAVIDRYDAEAFAQWSEHQRVEDGPISSAAVALADLLRTALNENTP